jgi:hypothetical protein
MQSSEEARVQNGRKPYFKPQIQVYGDLREITQAVGKNGLDDGGPPGNSGKTAP